MSTPLDHRWAIAKETTFGTAVTTSRFYVRTKDCKHKWNPRRRSGAGVQSGGYRTQLGGRTYLPTGQGEITIKVPVESKSFGLLFDVAFSVPTVTTITGGSQMLFHHGVTGTVKGSATIQFVDVMNDAAGTELVTTYAGCTVTKWKLSQDNEANLSFEVTFDALSRTTATAAATKSYTQGVIFDSYQAVAGLGGTLVAPTTTALATGLTAFNDIRSWSLEADYKPSTDRWNINAGSRSQPNLGVPDLKFSLEAEHNSTTLTAASAAGTLLPFYSTYTTTEAISAGFSQLQVVVPQISPVADPDPDPESGGTSTLKVDCDVWNNGTMQDFYLVYRTLDVSA